MLFINEKLRPYKQQLKCKVFKHDFNFYFLWLNKRLLFPQKSGNGAKWRDQFVYKVDKLHFPSSLTFLTVPSSATPLGPNSTNEREEMAQGYSISLSSSRSKFVFILQLILTPWINISYLDKPHLCHLLNSCSVGLFMIWTQSTELDQPVIKKCYVSSMLLEHEGNFTSVHGGYDGGQQICPPTLCPP